VSATDNDLDSDRDNDLDVDGSKVVGAKVIGSSDSEWDKAIVDHDDLVAADVADTRVHAGAHMTSPDVDIFVSALCDFNFCLIILLNNEAEQKA